MFHLLQRTYLGALVKFHRKSDPAAKVRLTEILSGISSRPVNDETGLPGAYDVELKYTLEMAASDASAAAKESSLAYPSLFTALKEQLG
jgi:uncharacterized protein (TIGR03435 family)